MYEEKIKRIKLFEDTDNLYPKNDGIILDKTGISLFATQFEIKTDTAATTGDVWLEGIYATGV